MPIRKRKTRHVSTANSEEEEENLREKERPRTTGKEMKRRIVGKVFRRRFDRK